MAYNRIQNWQSKDFDQGDLLKQLQTIKEYNFAQKSEDVKEGFCFAAALYWLSRKKRNSKESSEKRVTEVSAATQVIMDLQAKDHEKRLQGRTTEQVINEVFAEVFGVWSGEELVGRTGTTVATIVVPALKTKKVPMLLQFKFTDRNNHAAGHSVALYHSSGNMFGKDRHLYLFDANCGEYVVPEEDAQTFIDNYLKDFADAFGGNAPGTIRMISVSVTKS
jgi:hypothetical protein